MSDHFHHYDPKFYKNLCPCNLFIKHPIDLGIRQDAKPLGFNSIGKILKLHLESRPLSVRLVVGKLSRKMAL